MGTVLTPRTWVDNEIPPHSTFATELYGAVDFLLNPPMCKVRQTTGQTIPNITWTALTFDKEDVDTDSIHSTTVNPSRLTPKTPGWYRGWYGVCGGTGTAGIYRVGTIRKNGLTTLVRSRADQKPDSTNRRRNVHGQPFFINFNGTTDYMEVWYYQDSGAAAVMGSAAQDQPEVFLRWFRRL